MCGFRRRSIPAAFCSGAVECVPVGAAGRHRDQDLAGAIVRVGHTKHPQHPALSSELPFECASL